MTGSVTGLLGNKDLIDYSMTKGAIHAFARSLATNLVDRGIRVNVVAPAPFGLPSIRPISLRRALRNSVATCR